MGGKQLVNVEKAQSWPLKTAKSTFAYVTGALLVGGTKTVFCQLRLNKSMCSRDAGTCHGV